MNQCQRCLKHNVDVHTCNPTDAIRKEYARGFADGQAKWIDTKDRMPQKGEGILFHTKEGQMYGGTLDNSILGGDTIFARFPMKWGLEWCNPDEVSHWMPLPEPPGVE